MINTSMYNYLMHNYQDKKDDVAICFLYKNFSYKFLKDEIDHVACFLVSRGIKKGDVVTVALPNIPSSVSVFYAVNKIGAISFKIIKHTLLLKDPYREDLTRF